MAAAQTMTARRERYRGLDPMRVHGREWAGFSPRQRKGLVSAAFAHWRKTGFPYYRLSSADITAEFERLSSQDPLTALKRGGALGSVVGLRLANHFQPGMWSVRVSRYRCPMDVFEDDDLLRAAIERAWTIWPDRCGANPSTLRRMLKTFPNTAAVSNFRPTLARAVISQYSRAGSTVLDFSAGFGGRLLGCVTLCRRYIGIEPCRDQVEGMRKSVAALALVKPVDASAQIYLGCAEHVLQSIPTSSADLVFSSPPYFDWERYSDQQTQSYVRYPSYEGWLAEFLKPCIEESQRILAPHGRLVLNVSGRARWPSRDDVLRIALGAGFKLAEEVPMLLARVPYLHPRSLGPFKPELLVVFARRNGRRA